MANFSVPNTTDLAQLMIYTNSITQYMFGFFIVIGIFVVSLITFKANNADMVQSFAASCWVAAVSSMLLSAISTELANPTIIIIWVILSAIATFALFKEQ